MISTVLCLKKKSAEKRKIKEVLQGRWIDDWKPSSVWLGCWSRWNVRLQKLFLSFFFIFLLLAHWSLTQLSPSFTCLIHFRQEVALFFSFFFFSFFLAAAAASFQSNCENENLMTTSSGGETWPIIAAEPCDQGFLTLYTTLNIVLLLDQWLITAPSAFIGGGGVQKWAAVLTDIRFQPLKILWREREWNRSGDGRKTLRPECGVRERGDTELLNATAAADHRPTPFNYNPAAFSHFLYWSSKD